MTANATIESLSYTNAATTETSSSNSHAGKTNAFEDIFKTVNKNYESQQQNTETSSSHMKNNSNVTTNKNTDAKVKDKSEDTSTTDSTEHDSNVKRPSDSYNNDIQHNSDKNNSQKENKNASNDNEEASTNKPTNSKNESRSSGTSAKDKSPQNQATRNTKTDKNQNIKVSDNATNINTQESSVNDTNSIGASIEVTQAENASDPAAVLDASNTTNTQNNEIVAQDVTSTNQVINQPQNAQIADKKNNSVANIGENNQTTVETQQNTNTASKQQTSNAGAATQNTNTIQNDFGNIGEQKVAAASTEQQVPEADVTAQSSVSNSEQQASAQQVTDSTGLQQNHNTLTQDQNPSLNKTQQISNAVIGQQSSLTKGTNQITNQTTEQQIANLKVEESQDSQNQHPEQNTLDQADTSDTNVQVSNESDTMFIESDVNINSVNSGNNNDLKNVSSKTSLTQEMLDKTNAKVANIENSNSSNAGANSNNSSNSNSNSHSLLDRQSAQEQAVKLTIENNSNTQNAAQKVDPANMTTNIATNITTDAHTEVSFAKTLDSVQSQPQTQTTKELTQSDILSQINNKLSNFKEDDTTKVSIVLKPENLGKINLELTNSKGGLTAQLTTDNTQVKEILDKSLSSLKDTLGSHGVNVNSVTVKVDETQKQSNDMFSFDGHTGQGDKEQSNNAGYTDEDKGSYEEEMNNKTDEPEVSADVEAEKVVSVGSYAGKIDYKV